MLKPKYKTVAICGGEGSGKSTYCNMLKDYVKKNNIECLLTREPGGTKIGEDIRKIILDENNTEMCPETELLLFMASRTQHLKEKVIPEMKKGKLIIFDRFYLSSLVYQGFVRGIDIKKIWEIHKISTNGFITDLNIVIDVPVEVGLERINKNNRKANRLDNETLEFHKKVREGYLYFVDNDYFGKTIAINGNRKREDVFKDIVNTIF